MKYSRYYPSIMYILTFLVLVTAFVFRNIIIVAACFFLIMSVAIYELIKFCITYEGELDIQTPDGSNQPYHPSVLYFENSWNGWEYWMAFTPMPIGKKPYTDRWECPCIVVSHDGVNWQYPNKKEYLDDLTDFQILNMDYFSDPHLVFDKDKNRLLLYYRLSEGKEKKKITLYRRESKDGICWTEREKIQYNNEVENDRPTSPAILKSSSGYYQMWYVAEGSRSERHAVYHLVSSDGVHFENRERIFLEKKVDPWHIDCQFINGIYYMLAFSFDEKITLLISNDGMDFSFDKIVLSASGQLGSFYRIGVYRSCLIKDSDTFKIYFSAKSGTRVCIGLMEGKNTDDLSIRSIKKKGRYKYFWEDFFRKYFLIEIKLTNYLLK